MFDYFVSINWYIKMYNFKTSIMKTKSWLLNEDIQQVLLQNNILEKYQA